MKKFISFAVALVMLLTMSIPMAFAAGAPDTVGDVASGYATDYQNATGVTTADEFVSALASGGTIYLKSDIDFAGKTYSGIASGNAVYLDGCGKTLKNIDISGTGDLGFFGKISGEIKNLNVGMEGASAKISSSGSKKAVGFVQSLNGDLTFDNVKIWASYNVPYGKTGGFVGYGALGFTVTIRNSEVNGVINSQTSTIGQNSGTGGFLGQMKSNVYIENSTNNAAIVGGKNPTGGFVGRTNGTSATIINCVNNGNVTTVLSSADACAGGFIGEAEGTNTVTGSINNGTITGMRDASGIVGGVRTTATVVSIDGCTNNGVITGDDKAAGIISEAGATLSVTNCTNTAAVTGSADSWELDNGEVKTTSSGIGGIVGGTYSASEDMATWTLTGNTNSGVVTNLKSANRVGAIVGYSSTAVVNSTNCTSTVDAVGSVGTAEGMAQAYVQFSALNTATNTRSIRFILALDEAAVATVENMNLKVSVQQVTTTTELNPSTGVMDNVDTVDSEVAVDFNTFGVLYRKLNAADIDVKGADGVVLYGLVITDVPEAVWNRLALDLTATDANGVTIEALTFSGSYAK